MTASVPDAPARLSLSRAWQHLVTITRHRHEVCRLCFKVGIPFQVLFHDLSKYAPTEFLVGARYYQGTKSPNTIERLSEGVSRAWMHHKGRNKHHFEYWMDWDGCDSMSYRGVPMPTRYVVEMFCDRVAACKIYQGKDYGTDSALRYYQNSAAYNGLMHPDTAFLLEQMLNLLARVGEAEALKTIRDEIVKPRRCHGEWGRW